MANDYKKLTGEYIHRIFCEILDTAPMKELNLESLDDIDYFHKVQEEGMDDETIPCFYRKYSNGAELFVNEDELNNDPYRVIDIMMSQLFDIYSDSLPMYEEAQREAQKIPIKGTLDGYNYWFEFSSSYMSMNLLRQSFDPTDLLDEHSEKSLRDKYLELISQVPTSDEELETKISTILYLFGKIAYFEDMTEKTGFARFFGKKSYQDISVLIDGKLGKSMNSVYQHLMKSVVQAYTATDYIKLNKLIMGIEDQIIELGGTQ